MSRDITATFDVLRQASADRVSKDGPEVLLLSCGLSLLERFLIDVNRIADAAETLARIEMERRQ